eukprot:364955-Chlamydomonas_euryale.AAC.22
MPPRRPQLLAMHPTSNAVLIDSRICTSVSRGGKISAARKEEGGRPLSVCCAGAVQRLSGAVAAKAREAPVGGARHTRTRSRRGRRA